MLEKNIEIFLDSPCEQTAYTLIQYSLVNNKLYTALKLGEYLEQLFPYSLRIKEIYSLVLYSLKKYRQSYDMFQNALEFKGIDEKHSRNLLFNQHFCINYIKDDYTLYNKEKVDYIINKKENDFPLVTVTMTSCKRFDLFQTTVNSLLNCFDIDKIDKFICIDDNSCEDDRTRMKELYPFFEFCFKNADQKGHAKSMNMIMALVKTPYIFHLEDDFTFFTKKNYIQEGLDILESNTLIGQCLINKNYAETSDDFDIKGGKFSKTDTGLRYYIHEQVNTPEKKAEWISKHGAIGMSNNYWPHFSLRPSLLKMNVLNKVGSFNENCSHFEMEYASRYIFNNYMSAFLEGIYCIHTGRLTKDRNDETKTNAYILNNESQFGQGTPPPSSLSEEGVIPRALHSLSLKTFVINLKRRPDRFEKFKEAIGEQLDFLNYERFDAIDGMEIKPSHQLYRIFEGNDYNMRRGMIGCALSHIKLMTDLINSEGDETVYLVLEDDIEIRADFKKNFLSAYSGLNEFNWDIAFIGHHSRNIDVSGDMGTCIKIEKWDVFYSMNKSLGGTTGYLITKEGAKKFLDFVDKTGMINCIDTMLQKSADILNVYYMTPHLVFSECYRVGKNNELLDSDIQKDFDSLEISFEDKLNIEFEFYKKNNYILIDFSSLNIEYKTYNLFLYCKASSEKIDELISLCVSTDLKYYTIDRKVIFIIRNEGMIERNFHRFKIEDKYTVMNVIL